MLHYIKITILLLVAVLFTGYSSNAQILQFEDLFKIYTSDSLSVKQFCADKHFNLKEIKDNWAAVTYKFEASDNNKVTLEIIFPNDTTANSVRLNYWFDGKKDYSNFKKSFKTNGFVRQSIKQVPAPVYTFAQRYKKENLQVELIQSASKPPYWLFLHKVDKYN